MKSYEERLELFQPTMDKEIQLIENKLVSKIGKNYTISQLNAPIFLIKFKNKEAYDQGSRSFNAIGKGHLFRIYRHGGSTNSISINFKMP